MFIHNHHALKKRPPIGGPFKINGAVCFLVPLTKGQWMIINESRLDFVKKRPWFADRNNSSIAYYAVTMERHGDKRKKVWLHSELLGLRSGKKRGDHINGVTLDNRIENIRPATHVENCRNAKRSRANTSGFKGVSFNKRMKLWIANIGVNGKRIFLGYHASPELAYAAYCEAAVKYFGEFARLV